MNSFCCKYCGMITDNPEIVPDFAPWSLPAENSTARFLREPYCYQYHITCPVCLGRTDFTRPEPFPTDKPSVKTTNCPNCGLTIYCPSDSGIDLDNIPKRVV